MLGLGSEMSPSVKAASVVLDVVAQVRAGKKPYQY